MRFRLSPAVIVFAAIVSVGIGVFLVWKAYPWAFSGNYTLRVATGPVGEHGARFLAAFKRELAAEHPRVQVQLIETPNLPASAAALKKGEVDAAVVRADDPGAADGRAVFVLRKLFVTFLAPGTASFDGVADLKGKTIGVLVRNLDHIDPMAEAVLGFYRIDDKHVARLTAKDLFAALESKRIAALLVVSPIGLGPLPEAVQIFRKAGKKPPKFLNLAEADAIAERFPVYQSATIPDGAVDASPPIPDDDVTTIATEILLVARASMTNYAAGEFTRLLLATKAKVAATIPEAGQLAAPSTDRDALIPAHPGTIAYLNGDEPDLLDESSNYIYFGSLITGAFGSLAAWITSLRNRRRLRELQENFARLPTLMVEARTAAGERFDALEEELDRLGEWFVEKFVADEITPDAFANANTRVGHIRAMVGKRRTALAAGNPVAAPLSKAEATAAQPPDRAAE